MMPLMRHRILNTFTGPFALIEHSDGSLATTWINDGVRHTLKESRIVARLLPDLSRRLKAYFAGDDSVEFDDVPTPSSGGGGEFFRACWDACRRIPRGETRTYGELAELAGSTPAAARAAGQSMRTNRLPIIIPCHRVIASGGHLHGFAGSCDADGDELAIKRALLRMERCAVVAG